MLKWDKVFSLLFLTLFGALNAFAQSDSLDVEESPPFELADDTLPPPPPESFKPFNWAEQESVEDWEAPRNQMTSFSGIDIGLISLRNNYGNPFSKEHPLRCKMPASFAFRVNLIHKKIRINKNLFGIAMGLGYIHEQISFKNATVFNNLSPGFSITDSIQYNTNQLRRNGVFAPLLLEFNSKNNNDQKNNIRVSFGVALSYYFSQQGLTKYTLNSNSHLASRITKIYGLEKWFGEFHFKLCYRNIGFFATSPMNSIFSQVNAFPITFGINANAKLF
jgi:hypothetical protein